MIRQLLLRAVYRALRGPVSAPPPAAPRHSLAYLAKLADFDQTMTEDRILTQLPDDDWIKVMLMRQSARAARSGRP